MNFLNFITEYFNLVILIFFIFLSSLIIIANKIRHKKSLKLFKNNIKDNLTEPTSLHPSIDESLCVGCGSCVKACPEGEILKLINHKAVLAYATKCVGHGACEAACPFGAIDLVFGTKTRGMDIPRITPDYESNVPGLYIAGELGGMGLIRNATKQGSLAARHAIEKLSSLSSIQTDFDVFIVGAGPAGFSAGLMAKEKNVKYKIIEQNSFGGTVYNFPRQKIVTSHPLDLPLEGVRKFKSNITSKEDLLQIFQDVKKKHKLIIDERVSFTSLNKMDNGVFEIETSKGKHTAKKVILAMGVRGSPRKLGLANEDLPKVTYNLIDPEEYKGLSIAIVGGGNAGLEAAQYLSKPHLKNDVYLIVRGGPKDAFSRANEQNQKLVFEQEEKKLVKILYNGEIKKIEEKTILVKSDFFHTEDHLSEIKNDFIFVFAGAEVPFKFLMSIGVEIDKAHGEKRKKA